MKKKLLVLLLALVVGFLGIKCLRRFLAEPGQTPPATVQTLPRDTEIQETFAATAPPETEPAGYDTVPAYYQTDYPYIRYGDGTIGSSGCGITCLAMAATYLTDREYLPDDLAWHFGGYGENNIQRLDYGIAQMRLPCEKNHDWRQTQQALQEGKIAIILVDGRSLFTKTEHFLLLTGINEEGRYLVIDPFRPNYSEDSLREGFENGFTEGQIVAGLEGSWVFDKAALPEEPFLFETQKPEFPETRYEGFEAGDKDVYLLACFLWAAAREEPQEAQQAVAELVLNRLVSPGYPDTVEAVMRQEDFYLWYRQMGQAQPDMTQYMAVTAALYGPHVLPMDVLHGAPRLSGAKEWGTLGSFTFLYER